MRRTIYLPTELAAQVDEYLRLYPGMTFSALVRETLLQRVAPRDISGLLGLIGIVKDAKIVDPERPEDDFVLYDR